jgi:hypothetical protein
MCWADLGPTKKSNISLLGQTRPRRQGWARIRLAHQQNQLGQNKSGPAQETNGGNYFPPILLHAERMFCMQKETPVAKVK